MQEFFESAFSAAAFLFGPLLQIATAFIAGGVVATLMSEGLQRRRDRKIGRMNRVENLVRVYQRYRRLLRQASEKRSDQELDFLHADFCAEIKILKFERRFIPEGERLYKLAQQMANIHRGQSRPGDEGSKLNQTSKDFDAILTEILKKV